MTRTAAEREALRLARALRCHGCTKRDARVGDLCADCTDSYEAIVEAMRRVERATLRRIRQAIRAARAEEVARWDFLAEKRKGHEDDSMRAREDCARVVQGIDVALGCVRAERRGR